MARRVLICFVLTYLDGMYAYNAPRDLKMIPNLTNQEFWPCSILVCGVRIGRCITFYGGADSTLTIYWYRPIPQLVYAYILYL